jgi:hypothetical protein
MGTVNEINPKIDPTVRIFDTFFEIDIEVDSNQYDAVNSFFQSVTQDEYAAKNLTQSLFRIAAEINVSVMSLLSQVEGKNAIEVTSFMAYYLNGMRSPATLLGTSVTITPNYYTARNVAS